MKIIKAKNVHCIKDITKISDKIKNIFPDEKFIIFADRTIESEWEVYEIKDLTFGQVKEFLETWGKENIHTQKELEKVIGIINEKN
jgi:hypothetical protein